MLPKALSLIDSIAISARGFRAHGSMRNETLTEYSSPRRSAIQPRQDFRAVPLCLRANVSQRQHRKRNHQQSRGGAADSQRMLWQNRDAAVNELDVHPVNQQRRLSEKDDRTEAPLACA